MADFLDAVFSPAPEGAEKIQEKEPESKAGQVPPPSLPAEAQKLTALEAKLQSLEAELLKERERALTSEIKLRETQAAQTTVEQTLQALYEKTAKERTEQEFRVIREKASARVDALEGRLDEFQRGILELLKQQNDTRRQADREVQESGHEGIERRLAAFERRILDLFQDFTQKRQGAADQEALHQALKALRAEVADNERLQAQNTSLLREEVKLMRAQLEQAATASQTMLGKKFNELEEKLLAAGQVAQAARLVIHAVDRLDPLLVDKPVLDELQKLREILAKTFLK